VRILSDNDGLIVHEADSTADFGFNVGVKPGESNLAEEKANAPVDERQQMASDRGRRGLKRQVQQQESAPQAGQGAGGAPGGPNAPAGGFARFSGAMGGRADGTMQFRNGAVQSGDISGNLAQDSDETRVLSTWSESGAQVSWGTNQEAEGVPAQPWTQAGGLSLVINQPTLAGNAFGFSKSGGNPSLVLKTRSAATRTTLWSLVEAAGWLIATIWACSALLRPDRIPLALSALIAVGSAAAFVLLPGDERWLAFALFVVAATVTYVLRYPRVEATAAPPA
jgi:hypothetical protein